MSDLTELPDDDTDATEDSLDSSTDDSPDTSTDDSSDTSTDDSADDSSDTSTDDSTQEAADEDADDSPNDDSDLSWSGSTGNDDFSGGTGDDDLIAGQGDDHLDGDDGDDDLYGDDGDDDLLGGAGDDDLYGGAGDDSLNGGQGLDVAYYEGSSDDYSVAMGASGWEVGAVNGDLDSLVEVERMVFGDGTQLALDIDGSAGEAYRIYTAAFGREPDSAGLGYWIAQMDDGMDLIEVAARFIDSAEFASLYGASTSKAEFLSKVYENVLGRAPDQAGYDWWLNEMTSNPEKTMAKVLADFCESAENRAGVAELVANGIAFEPWLG